MFWCQDTGPTKLNCLLGWQALALECNAAFCRCGGGQCVKISQCFLDVATALCMVHLQSICFLNLQMCPNLLGSEGALLDMLLVKLNNGTKPFLHVGYC